MIIFYICDSPEDKGLIWKKRLPGRVTIKPTVSNGVIIITSIVAPDIYFFELDQGNLLNQIGLKDTYVIKDIQQNQNDILILTNNGLIKFSEGC